MAFIGPWEIAIILTAIILFFLYKWFRGGKRAETKLCPGCGRSVPIDGKHCQECGYNFLGKNCPKCGVQNPSTSRFCSNCAEKLT